MNNVIELIFYELIIEEEYYNFMTEMDNYFSWLGGVEYEYH